MCNFEGRGALRSSIYGIDTKSFRRCFSTILASSGGDSTSTASPHMYRCQHISNKPDARNRTISAPSLSLSTV